MAESILRILEGVGAFLSVFSVAAIVVGLLASFSRYLGYFRKLSPEASFRKFKLRLSRVLMVALEILVVADIIETITAKITFDSLATLGLLVIVRKQASRQ